MAKKREKRKLTPLVIVLAAALTIVLGVIFLKLREYAVSADYYESLRGLR